MCMYCFHNVCFNLKLTIFAHFFIVAVFLEKIICLLSEQIINIYTAQIHRKVFKAEVHDEINNKIKKEL